jgi:putative spermidine/putrescine transport system ATP-binding protein
MPYLAVRDITKIYATTRAVDSVSFTAEKGEIIALLGPSGCGKTTLLNLIAGFLQSDGGTVLVDGADLADTPPHRRDMAMVFQSYALFPHMTVEANVAFGLDMRGVSKAETKERVAAALKVVKLDGMQSRYPRQLSGGQQQRIALARALVVRPSLILLDEPLSNLDALLRKNMREDMRQILKDAGITAVVVTHDQEEALVMADRIILMSSGRIEQISVPSELYEYPRTVFGARFMEMSNLIDGVIVSREGDVVVVETGIGLLRAREEEGKIGDGVTIAVRPENIALAADHGENRLSGQVMRDSYHGSVRRIDIAIGNQTIIAHVPVRRCGVKLGEKLSVSWHASDARALTSEPSPRRASSSPLLPLS